MFYCAEILCANANTDILWWQHISKLPTLFLYSCLLNCSKEIKYHPLSHARWFWIVFPIFQYIFLDGDIPKFPISYENPYHRLMIFYCTPFPMVSWLQTNSTCFFFILKSNLYYDLNPSLWRLYIEISKR